MTINIAINGFGRIGRNVLRQLYAGNLQNEIKVAAINDLTDARTLAHLLKYDSVHGTMEGKISHQDDSIRVNEDQIKIFSEKDPSKLPWSSLKIDVVLECTGIFTKKEKASMHLSAGAKKVLISAPSPDPDITIAFGINNDKYDKTKHHILSGASCTTNCLAPVAKVILENFGIVKGCMTTIHSYTNDQSILDLPHKDLRRARAAAMSMIPTTTGAAKALGLVIPELVGKIDGFSVRVPTPDVSLVDFVVEVEQDTDVESVNRALKNASQNKLKGVLDVNDEPLVSVDYIGNPHSSIVDSMSTMVIQKRMVKAVAWYDNEMGFSSRMLDIVKLIS
jgi:glyceraldehyde 3-phosphate dehydrogenase